MEIVFTPEETKKIPRYCVIREENDGVCKITSFGIRQKRLLLDFIDRQLSDKYVVRLEIKKVYE